MTLVLAHVENEEVYLLADTRMTYDDDSLGKKPFDALKIFFFNPRIAIAYAGLQKPAHEIIMQVYLEQYWDDAEKLSSRVAELNNRNGADFLVAESGGNKKVIKVHSGGCTTLTSWGWIGDSGAANHIASAYTGNEIFEISKYFDSVTADPEFPKVGGYSVLARGNKQGFKFIPHMKLTSPKYIPTPDQWQTIDFGTARSGGFGYTTLSSPKHGDNGWGVYFFQGQFGYYFNVQLKESKFEILTGYANTVDGFIRLVENDIKQNLEYCGLLG